MRTLLARHLRPGDRIAIVAPAGPIDSEDLDFGVLESWGLEPVLMPGVRQRLPPKARLEGQRETG